MNNYVKLKEMELQRKINELNEQVNYLNAQNAELEEASRRMANYVPNLNSYEEVNHKVNFLKSGGSKPFLYMQTETSEEDSNYIPTSNERRIGIYYFYQFIDETQYSERESSDGDNETQKHYIQISERSNESGSLAEKKSKPGRSLIPYKSSNSSQSKTSYISKKSCKNASLNDANNFLDENRENRDSNRIYNVQVVSRTRSVKFEADGQHSAETANWG